MLSKMIKVLFYMFFKFRKNERLKRKAKRAEKVLNNEDLGPSKKKLKSNTMANSACKIRVAVDCSFDDLMTDRVINFTSYFYFSLNHLRAKLSLF